MVPLTPSFAPSLIRGIKVFKNNPFKFEIVMSQGDDTQNPAANDNSLVRKLMLKQEANKLVRYFLAALTVPEKDMWVNLSPYERNRIVPKEFGITEMGKELLAQDYLLKQVTASVMYPEGATGKEFWRKIYAEAYKRFGTTQVPVNTFNKVWIVPDQAEVYENGVTNTAVILKSRLKVMLEEDYLALNKNTVIASPEGAKQSLNPHALASEIVREIILPQLTKEVNEGKNFATLRQVYNSLILAFWYKSKLKQSLIAQGYVDRKKTVGVDVSDKNVDQEIYQQYLRSYKKGVYNYIKEEVDPIGQTIPRKYFSGGLFFGKMQDAAQIVSDPDSAMSAEALLVKVKPLVFSVALAAQVVSAFSTTAALANSIDLGHMPDRPAVSVAENGKNACPMIQEAYKKVTGVELKDAEVKRLAWMDGLVGIDGKPVSKDEISGKTKLSNSVHTISFNLAGIKQLAATPAPAAEAAPAAAAVQRTGILNVTVSDAPNQIRLIQQAVLKATGVNLELPEIHKLAGLGVVQIDGKKITSLGSNLASGEHKVSVPWDALNKVHKNIAAAKPAEVETAALRGTITPLPVKAEGPADAFNLGNKPPSGFVVPASAAATEAPVRAAEGGAPAAAPAVAVDPEAERLRVIADAKNVMAELARPASVPAKAGALVVKQKMQPPSAGALPSPDDMGKAVMGTPSGELSFVASPNFFGPAPVGGDNYGSFSQIPIEEAHAKIIEDIAANPLVIGRVEEARKGTDNVIPEPTTPENFKIINDRFVGVKPSAPVIQDEKEQVLDMRNNNNWKLLQDKISDTAPEALYIVSTSKDNTYKIEKTFSKWQGDLSGYDPQSYLDFAYAGDTDNHGKPNVRLEIRVPPDNFDGIIPKAKIKAAASSPENGDAIIEGLIKSGVVNEVSPTELHLNPHLAQKDKVVQGIAKDDFKKVWAILDQIHLGDVDIANIDSWDRYDNPQDINAQILARKNLYVRVFWKDANGHEQSGVIYASTKAAKIAEYISMHAMINRDINRRLLDIFSTPEYGQQVKMAGLVGLRLDPNDTEPGNAVVGAYVERDEYGFALRVTGFIRARDLGTDVRKIPGTNGGYEVVTISKDGRDLKNNPPQDIKPWPFSEGHVLATYSTFTQGELQRLNDPITAAGSFNAYLPRDGNYYKRGEIILDLTLKNFMTVATAKSLAVYDQQAIHQYKGYLSGKIVVNAMGAVANMGLSFLQDLYLPNAMTVGNLFYDRLTRPDKIGTSFIPDRESLEEVYARLVLLREIDKNNDYITHPESQPMWDKKVEEAWNAKSLEAKKALGRSAIETVKGLYTNDDMTKFRAYLERNKKLKGVYFFLGQISALAQLGSQYLPTRTVTDGSTFAGVYKVRVEFLAPKNQAVYDALAQTYLGYDGTLNVLNLVSRIAQGQELRSYSFNQLVGQKPKANYNIGPLEGTVKPMDKFWQTVSKVASVIGLTTDLKSWANQMSGGASNPNRPFPLAPAVGRFNFYLFGFPLSLINEKELYNRLDKMVNDDTTYAYIVEDGHFTSIAEAFKTTEFRALFKVAKAVPIGKVSKVGVDGHPLEVPIYEVDFVTPTGKHITKIAMFTLKAIQEQEMDARRDLERYQSYALGLSQGAIIINYGSNGGTFEQNIWTGLYKDYDQQSLDDYPNAYTWTQMQANRVFMLEGNFEPVKRNLGFYKNVMLAQLKERQHFGIGFKSQFQGIGKSYHAYSGASVDGPDAPSTAAVALAVMDYEAYTGDLQFHQLLTESIKWLTQQKHNDSPEPNSVVFAALDNYGRIYHDQWALSAAEGYLKEVAALWDPVNYLIKHGKNDDTFTEDDQGHWFKALGPQRFIHTFMPHDSQGLGKFFRAMKQKFGVEVMNRHMGKMVHILDLADEANANRRVTRLPKENGMRLGLPEVTSDYVGILKLGQPYVVGADTGFVKGTIHDYSVQLTGMRVNNTLPQATEKDQDIGFGNGRSIQGRASLAALSEYELNVVYGVNEFSVKGAHLGNDLGLKPITVSIPKYQLTFEDLDQGPLVLAGKKNYDEYSTKLGVMIAQEKIPGHHNTNFLYHDPTNDQHVVIVDPEDRVEDMQLVAPQKDVIAYAKIAAENVQVSQDLVEAARGQGQFPQGAVIFETPDGKRIGMPRGGHAVQDVLDFIAKLSIPERSFDQFMNFNHIVLHGYVLDGKPQDIKTNVIFPLHKPLATQVLDPFGLPSTVIAEDSFVRFTVNDQKVTVFDYDPNTGKETATRTYADLPGGQEATVKAIMAQSSLKDRRALFADKIPLEESATTWAAHIDRQHLTLDQVALDQPILIKRHVDYTTGQISTQAYGLFDRPLWEADEHSIIYNYFNINGLFKGAITYENTGTIQDPRAGTKRFEDTAYLIRNGKAELVTDDVSDLRDQGFVAYVFQREAIHDVFRASVFDAHTGNKIVGFYTDFFHSSMAANGQGHNYQFNTPMLLYYDPKRFSGKVAVITKVYDNLNNLIKTSYTTGFNLVNQDINVEEHDQRSNAIVLKTIEDVFGQPLEESDDTLGSKRVTTYKFDSNQRTVSSTTRIDGRLAVTGSGRFDSARKIWILEETYWNYLGNDAYIYFKDTKEVSPGGRLIVARDVEYPNDKYTVNGQEYPEPHRRYLVDYDEAGNVNRVTEGEVDKNGKFNVTQVTNLSGYVNLNSYFFAALDSTTLRVVDGKETPFTKSHLLTSQDEFHKTGELQFQVTSLLDNSNWIEIWDREGHIIGQIIKVYDEKGNYIGDLELRLGDFNVQGVATSSKAVLHQNGKTIVLSTSTDATTLEEAQKGLIRSQIVNNFSGLATQELKDRHGRVIETTTGVIDPTTGVFKPQRKTILYDFNRFDIARSAVTFVMSDGAWVQDRSSGLLSDYGGIKAEKGIRFSVESKFLSSTVKQVVWQEVKNLRGNVTHTDKGVYKDGKLDVNRRTDSTYQGVPQLLNVASSSETYMVVNGKDIMKTDESRLMTVHGRVLDPNTVNVADIFNGEKMIRFEGRSYYQVVGQDSSAYGDTQEIRDALGNAVIILHGKKADDGSFKTERIEYRIYDQKFGNFGIPTSSFATTIGPDGKEQVVSFSNNTRLKNGYLIYRTQQGIGLEGLTLTDDVFKNHEIIAKFLEDNHHHIRLAHLTGVLTQVKDEEGKAAATFSGYSSFDPETGFGQGNPMFVTLNDFDPKQVSQPVALNSRTYAWESWMGKDIDTDFQALAEGIKSRSLSPITSLDQLTFENGAAVYKDLHDKREVGLLQQSLRVDGTIYFNYYEGSGVDGPEKFKLYFDENELPAYGVDLSNGDEKPFSVYRNTLFKYDGQDYVLIDEFIRDDDGKLVLDQGHMSSSTLTQNGNILMVKRGPSIRKTPFSSTLDADALARNGAAGTIIRLIFPTQGERIINYGHEHMADPNVKSYMNDQQAQSKADKAMRSVSANDATLQDFEDRGFTRAQAQIIVADRINNGAFLGFDDFKNRLENDLINAHPSSGKLINPIIVKARFRSAMANASRLRFSLKTDALDREDYKLLYAGRSSVGDFMAALKDIYGVTPAQEPSYTSALKMFAKYLTPDQLSAIVASQQFRSLFGRYSRQRGVEVILRLMFAQVRDSGAYQQAVRQRVDDIIIGTGLDKAFPDQIAALKDTFLKNLNVRLLPEGFQFHEFDFSTDILAYSWDDLDKAPDMERQVRSDLVSIEKLFVFQVIFQRALFGLAGQGRAEEWLWKEYVWPRLREQKALKDPMILERIKAFKQVFHAVMLQEVRVRLEANRDPKGREKYLQYVMNEEIYNDAFRYLLGQKDPTLNDAGWVLSQKIKDDVAPLREHLENLLGQIDTIVGMGDNQRAVEVNRIANEIKPVMLAFVAVIDKEIGIPMATKRMEYWELTVKPLIKLMTNNKLRQRVFSHGGPYSQTNKDMKRRIAHYALIGAVTILFIFLGINAHHLLRFMALPYMMNTPWSLIAAGAVSLVFLFLGAPVKNALMKSLNKGLNNPVKEQKQKAINTYRRNLKGWYWFQAGALIAAFVATPFLGLPAAPFVVPAILQQLLHFSLILVFMETWRLTFPAMNYFISMIAEAFHNLAYNTYELNNTKKPQQIIDRLMTLMTYTAPANGSLYKIRGQENIAAFINVVKEMSSNTYFYADNKTADGRSELSDVLTTIAADLVDENGDLRANRVAQLQQEIEAFVAQAGQPVRVEETAEKTRTTKGSAITSASVGQERPALQHLIDYINNNFRQDKGADPMSWDHVIPLSISINGYAEDWYFNGQELLDVKKVEGETEEFTHRLGQLAHYKTEAFLRMVNHLTGRGSTERAELLKMIDDPVYVPAGIASWSMWPAIIEWANLQLPTGYANASSQLKTLKQIYTFYARLFNVPDPEAAADEKIRVIDRNLLAMDALDRVLGGKLREVVDALIETNYTSTYVIYPDGQTKGLEKEKLDALMAKANDKGEYDVIKAEDKKKYDRLMMTKLLDLITKDRLFPARILGGGLNTNPLDTENYHGAKWNQKTAVLPFLIGPVVLNLDADHRADYVGMFGLPNHLLDYHFLPGLAISTPVIKHDLTKGMGVYGDILPVSENAFYAHGMSGKDLVGGLLAYGKLFERISALRHAEGLNSYVAEDAQTALNVRRFGFITGWAGYVQQHKGWPNAFHSAITPQAKWSSDTVEIGAGRTAGKLSINSFVDWPFLANNWTTNGFWYYLKKRSIVTYIRWLEGYFLMFDWNLFAGVPLTVWIFSIILSQSVSHGLFSYKIFEEGRGFIRGTISAIFHIIFKMVPNYMFNIFFFSDTAGNLGPKLLVNTKATSLKGANQTRFINKAIIYVRNSPAIKPASILAMANLIFVGIDPTRVFLWSSVLLLGFMGVSAPFLLNPVRLNNRLGDNLDNAKDMIRSGGWGWMDSVQTLQYRLGWIFPYSRKIESEKEKRVLDAVDAFLPKPFRELPASAVQRAEIFKAAFPNGGDARALELTEYIDLFLQDQGHYRSLYRNPVEPAIDELWLIVAENAHDGLDFRRANNRDTTPKYKEDLKAKLPLVEAYLNALKKVPGLEQRIISVQTHELEQVKAILKEEKPGKNELDHADWLLNQLSWLPHDMQSQAKIRAYIANKAFGAIGVTAVLMAAFTYIVIPFSFLWNMLPFNTRQIREDMRKTAQIPKSTEVPLENQTPPAVAQRPIADAAMRSVFQQVGNGSADEFAQQITSSMDQAIHGGVRNRLNDLGGIDLGRTQVTVQGAGSIQTAFDDPAMLRLLLNSDGLAPIIYDVKAMTPAMVNSFVGLN
jgi:hypothetical protein